jgi:hypothetical protein
MSDSPIKIDVDLTKPATVLVEKIAGAVGMVYEPTRIRKMAKAEADSMIILAKGKVKATALEKRAAARLLSEESRKQKNMELVIEKTIPQLDKEADPSHIDDDWLMNFFERSRLTSDSQMQDLWSRLLAGEANKPGSYSQRTVNLVAELDKKDAELFGRLTNFVWIVLNRPTPLIFNVNHGLYKKYGLSFDVFEHLATLGLVNFDSLAGYQLQAEGTGGRLGMYYQGKTYIVQVPEGRENHIAVGNVTLTNQGLELLRVSPGEEIPDFVDYVKEQVESFEDHKFLL